RSGARAPDASPYNSRGVAARGRLACCASLGRFSPARFRSRRMRRPRIRIPLVALALSSLLGSGSAAAQGFHLKLDPALSESRAAITEGRPVYGSGERLFGRSDRDVTLEGDAEVRKAGSVIRADRLTYYQADDELLAAGRVRVTRQGNVFTGPQLALKLDANTGWFESPSYYLAAYDGRGS